MRNSELLFEWAQFVDPFTALVVFSTKNVPHQEIAHSVGGV